MLRQHGIRRGVHALHFVEDHAFVAERARRAVGFDVPAFLLEAVLVDAGEEHGVEVDVDEVVEILKVGAGDRVAGLVREGEGVEEGLERPLEQFDEGSFTGYFSEPQRTECSRIWATPVESFGGVRNVAPKHLFSSLLTMESNSAPVASCRHSLTVPETSESLSSRTS